MAERPKTQPVMDIHNVEEALIWQAEHAKRNLAPCTGRVIDALRAVAKTDTEVARRMNNWPGLKLQDAIDAIVVALVKKFDARLAPWLDGPPQTNEAGRSASIMAGLMWLSQFLGPKFELNEIGASAGINTMIERYFYDLGGTRAGPEASPMRIVPEWRGALPPAC